MVGWQGSATGYIYIIYSDPVAYTPHWLTRPVLLLNTCDLKRKKTPLFQVKVGVRQTSEDSTSTIVGSNSELLRIFLQNFSEVRILLGCSLGDQARVGAGVRDIRDLEWAC